MKTTIEVNVTEEDINNGIRGNPTACPISLALKRVLHKEGIEALVIVDQFNLTLVTTTTPKEMYQSLLSEEAHFFVTRFDSYRRVRPFQFTVTLPEELKNGSC